MYKQLRNKYIAKIMGIIFVFIFLILIGFAIRTDKIILYGLAIIMLLIVRIIANIWFKRHFFDEYLEEEKKRKEIYSFFSNKEIKKGLYYDAVIWLWRDLHDIYFKKNSDDEINSLKSFICEDVRSIALKKRDAFQAMCLELANTQDKTERIKILNVNLSSMLENKDTEIIKNNVHRFSFNKNNISLFVYLLLIAIHIIGCLFSNSPLENGLFYISSDIVTLLLFFKLIDDRKQ